jgi:L-lysine 6-transaminase
MPPVEPSDVHATLRRHSMLAGHPIVLDLAKSQGLFLRDALSQMEFLDFASFYASNALGFRHPRLLMPAFRERLLDAALVKVGNPEFYTSELASFVSALERIAVPKTHPHYFFVEGGALAVENAMKTAMDWKVRKNLSRGAGEIGTEILHFEQAFHGRAGYTLSVTNTDPAKTLYFPKFDWPRVPSPATRFPLDAQNLSAAVAAEAQSLAAIERAFDERGARIAAILIEPIQGEGGDRHFRPEFLQALRRVADAREALLIFDEVQTGVGVTGKFWAHEHALIRPDIVCFAKKLQVGGFFASTRIDDVDNVFKVPSRISSTWGGGLADMVRATEILEVIEDDKLLLNAEHRGNELLAGLETLAQQFPGITNVRGKGLFCAFDLRSAKERADLLKACFAERLMVLSGGPLSIRLRPPLVVNAEEIALALTRLQKALSRLATA